MIATGSLRRWVAFISLVALAVTAPAPAQPDSEHSAVQLLNEIRDGSIQQPAPELLARIIDAHFHYTMTQFPGFATYAGYPTGHDRWTDNSFAAVARRDADARLLLEVLNDFDRDGLAMMTSLTMTS